jgi:solute carrier family 25 (peroxisomal adenine nucleotide transporter), member 17
MVATVRELLNEEGVSGLWTGLVPALILVANPAVQYVLYEQLGYAVLRSTKQKRVCHAKQQNKLSASESSVCSTLTGATRCMIHFGRLRLVSLQLTALQIFVLGAIGKTAATIVTYPWIVLKSRMQASHDQKAKGSVYSSTFDALMRTYQQDGIAGFFNGLGSKIAQSVLTAAILFVLKEKLLVVTRRLLVATARK